MRINDFTKEIKDWKFTSYKAINFSIGLLSLFLYEFIGRPIYRPYIYKHEIPDFYIADTLGNTLGTTTTIFFLIALLSTETRKGHYLIKLGTVSVIIFELAHPLLGKSIDLADIIATVLTGFICFFIYNLIFNNIKSPKNRSDM